VRVPLLVPLTASHDLRLIAQVSFWSRTEVDGNAAFTTAPDPFAGHPLALVLNVMPTIPLDRVIHLSRRNSGVFAYAVHLAHARLMYHCNFTKPNPRDGCANDGVAG